MALTWSVPPVCQPGSLGRFPFALGQNDGLVRRSPKALRPWASARRTRWPGSLSSWSQARALSPLAPASLLLLSGSLHPTHLL